ncbi:hypothetical protein ZWY2020_037925 [Hordeum vulgare]|nr:hypothetical protein ZWY2020_037925 [Hordeum vulgare]
MSDDGCGGAVQAPPVKPPAALSPTRLSRSDLHMQSRSHATAGQLRLPRPVTLNWDSTHPKLQCHDPLLPATYLVPATICKDSEIAVVKKKVDDLYFSVTKLRNHHTKRTSYYMFSLPGDNVMDLTGGILHSLFGEGKHMEGDSPPVDDWKAEYMHNLVFSPKNEILREELLAEIQELAT